MRLLHFSDPHVQLPDWRRRSVRLQLGPLREISSVELWKGRGRKFDGAEATLRQLAADARSLAFDHVVCTGDFTQLGHPEEFARARDALGGLPGDPDRFTAIAGNHDRYPWRGRLSRLYVEAQPDQVFRAFCRLGGDQGWLVYNVLWRMRGFIDRMVGGPGLRRGRRDPAWLHLGEAVDFWRVELVERPRILRLRAEMKVPGHAWLQFTAVPEGSGTRLIQTALFAPRGLPGLAYWYAMFPAHLFIFGDMAKAVARLALKEPVTAVEPRLGATA